jgi:hypothetical protein
MFAHQQLSLLLLTPDSDLDLSCADLLYHQLVLAWFLDRRRKSLRSWEKGLAIYLILLIRGAGLCLILQGAFGGRMRGLF